MTDFIPATTGLSRVFLIDGRAGPEAEPEYFSCYRAQALSQSFGDVTDIECPDPNRPGAFVTVGQFQSGEERAELTLEGRYAIDVRSALLRLARNKCNVDVQLHFGDCENLSDHNSFKKVLYLENVLLSSYNTEDLGALTDDDVSAVNESVDLSADNIYDIIPNTWASKAGDLVTNEAVDGVVCDEVQCGECGDPSGGCNRMFVITLAAGGSPTTPADVVYSIDGGTTWYAHDIESLGVADNPSAVDCIKGFLVVVSNDNGYAHYAPLSDFDAFGTDPVWTEVQEGFVAGGEPNDLSSPDGAMAFIVGDSGYVYRMGTPSNGVTVLDAGTLTVSNLTRVDALSDSFCVAVGEDGVILFTEDGTSWQLLTTPPVGVGVDFTAVAVKSKDEWWVATEGGVLYYTTNAGLNWTIKALPTGTATGITDIAIQNDSIMYVTWDDGTNGYVAGSFNGGYDFVAMPFGSAILPAADVFNFVAPCPNDPELVLTGGLDDDAADGIVVTAKM